MTSFEWGALGVSLIVTLWALAGWIGLRAACKGRKPSPDWLQDGWGE